MRGCFHPSVVRGGILLACLAVAGAPAIADEQWEQRVIEYLNAEGEFNAAFHRELHEFIERNRPRDNSGIKSALYVSRMGKSIGFHLFCRKDDDSAGRWVFDNRFPTNAAGEAAVTALVKRKPGRIHMLGIFPNTEMDPVYMFLERFEGHSRNPQRHPGLQGVLVHDHVPGNMLGGASFGDTIADFGIDPEKPHRCSHGGPVALQFRDGTILVFYANTSDHNLDGWSEYATSRDGGKTWDRYHPFPFSYQRYSENRLRPVWVEEGLVTARGTAILLLSEFQLVDNFRNRDKGTRVANYVMRSTDNGRTWSEPRRLPEELTGYPAAMASKGKTIYALFETRWGHSVYASRDEGENWIKRADLPLNKNAQYGGMCFMEDGNLLVGTYVESDEKNLYYCVGTKGGRKWTRERKAFLDKKIRDPELAYLDGKYYLHGRSGQNGPGAHRFVLYQSEDGFNWNGGVIINGNTELPDGYSDNCVIRVGEGGEKQERLLVLYSIGYGNRRTSEHVFYVVPEGE